MCFKANFTKSSYYHMAASHRKKSNLSVIFNNKGPVTAVILLKRGLVPNLSKKHTGHITNKKLTTVYVKFGSDTIP